jgi:D-serine deaminase-like pyridoxal phosphate-dependent protein
MPLWRKPRVTGKHPALDGSRGGGNGDQMQPLSDFLGRLALPQTPMPVVRRTALLANLAAMQAACDAANRRLRADGKMHNCSTPAQLQLADGAVSCCCHTVTEAEIYAHAGITELLVTAPVAPAPLRSTWRAAFSPKFRRGAMR